MDKAIALILYLLLVVVVWLFFRIGKFKINGENVVEIKWRLFGRKPGEGERLVPGMVLALEPMTAAGKRAVQQLDDDSFVTADDSLSAHFEHTVAITDRGPEVLTK